MALNEVTGVTSNENLNNKTLNKTPEDIVDSGAKLTNIDQNATGDTEVKTDGSVDKNRKRKIDDEESLSNDKASEEDKGDSISEDQEQDSSAKALYGLSPQYLKSLNITPPLDQWILVRNFRCDKSELRDALELAGHVVVCAVVTATVRMANVMYSHPLEAVQAVSMFHGQTFYGQKLNVIMLRNPVNTVILPKGLLNVGPGLGKYGKPLRNVAEQYENFLQQKPSNIDPILFVHDKGTTDKANEQSAYAKRFGSNPLMIINVDEVFEDSQKSNKKSRMIQCNSLAAQKSPAGSEHSSTDSDNIWDDNEAKSSKTSSKPTPIQRPYNPANLSAPQTIRTLKPVVPPMQISPSRKPVPTMCPPPSHLEMHRSFIPGPSNPMVPGIDMIPPRPPNMNAGHPGGPTGPYGSMNGPRFPGNPLMMPNQNVRTMFTQPTNPMPSAIPMPPAMPMLNANPMPSMNPMPSSTPMPCATPMPSANPMPSTNPMSSAASTPFRPPGNVTLHFRNLPPTTTFALLSEKVSLCGQVLSLRLTTPGCAVACFAQMSDADRCYRFFHGKCIDGCVVEVMIS